MRQSNRISGDPQVGVGRMQTLDAPGASTEESPIHRNANLLAILVGVIGFFVIWGLLLDRSSQDSSIDPIVSLPTLLLVVGSPIFVLLGVYGWAGVVDALTYIFRRSSRDGSAAEAVTLFQLWAAFAMATGFLTTMIAMITLLARLDDPRHLGPGIALALVGQLYGVFTAVVCIACAALIARRHHGCAALSLVTRPAVSMAGMIVIAGAMTALVAFGILMLAIAPAL